MSLSIKQPVGAANSPNEPDDVLMVQKLLNKHRKDKLAEDKDCGAKTIQAIHDFQKGFLANHDGVVEPGGTSWKRLLAEPGTKIQASKFALLPQQSGFGYYSYSEEKRQFGTPATIKALQDVALTFALNAPDIQIAIGDISFTNGGHMSPHDSHQRGKNVDLRPIRKDRAHKPVTIHDTEQYDQEATRLLVESLRAHTNVRSILFNDKEIEGVTNYKGHDNHLHVNMKS